MNAGVDEALPRSEDTDSQQDPRAGLSTEEVQDGEAVDHTDSDDEMDPDRIDSALEDFFNDVASGNLPPTIMEAVGDLLVDLSSPHSVALSVFSLTAEVLMKLFPNNLDAGTWLALYKGAFADLGFTESFGGSSLDTKDFDTVSAWLRASPFGNSNIAVILDEYANSGSIPRSVFCFFRYVSRNCVERAFPEVPALKRAAPLPAQVSCKANTEEMDTFRQRLSMWPYHPPVRDRGAYPPETGVPGLCVQTKTSKNSQTGGSVSFTLSHPYSRDYDQ
jgi:hypothetical protein